MISRFCGYLRRRTGKALAMNLKCGELAIIQVSDPKSPYLSRMCGWMMDWWGKDEGFSAEKMDTYMRNSLCVDRIPQTFLLLCGGAPAGMYQLSMADVDVRPDIYPWLVNVYVDQAYRGRGFLNMLMRSAAGRAASLGIKKLYLFTKHTALYERYGWAFVEEFHTFLSDGDVQRLYCLDDGSAAPMRE